MKRRFTLALAGLVIAIAGTSGAQAQASDCDALRAQTDKLIRSYARSAGGLSDRIAAFETSSAALSAIYNGAVDKVTALSAVASEASGQSPSQALGTDGIMLDEAGMKSGAANLAASVDAIDLMLDTLSFQGEAMQAALGILESQCAGASLKSDPASAQLVSADMPPITTPAPATPMPGAPSSSNPVAPVIPTIFTNYWTHADSGRVYEGRDQTLLRNGKVAVALKCDGFGTVREQMGKICQGQWFDQSGSAAGDFRAVYVINAASKLPMLVGELTTMSAPDTWMPWDFLEMTPAEAEATGLGVPTP